MEALFSFSVRLTLITLLALLFVISSSVSGWRPAIAHAQGATQVCGLIGPVTIERDAAGVAYIRAGREIDAHFGLGYAHAQDRLWQMEFQRRVGNGRLAEILGEKALGTDSLFRAVGLRRAAAAAWARFSPEERRPIEAYVAGVNAYLNSPDRRLSPEFAILGVEPEQWRPEDALVWGKALAWGVSSNWDKELLRVQLIAKLGDPAKAAQLMPAYTDDGPTIIPGAVQEVNAGRSVTGENAPSSAPDLDSSIVAGLLELNRGGEEQTGLGADGFGSNNWVIGGGRTTTGRPLLANGPLISDVINPAGQPLALRWTGNDPTDNGVLASLAYNRARNWREFLDASRIHRPFDLYHVGMAVEAALEKNTAWCDDVRTPQVETCGETLASALTEGLAAMAQAQGTDDILAWRWDRAHHAIFPHQPFDNNPQLKPVFSRSIPNDGDKFTVNVASIFRWDDYHQLHSAQYRQIVDFSNLNNSRFVIAPGQSGDLNSPHYDDLLERWRWMKYLSMRFGGRTIDDAANGHLTPEP